MLMTEGAQEPYTLSGLLYQHQLSRVKRKKQQIRQDLLPLVTKSIKDF
jgi:hypothetical protein